MCISSIYSNGYHSLSNNQVMGISTTGDKNLRSSAASAGDKKRIFSVILHHV